MNNNIKMGTAQEVVSHERNNVAKTIKATENSTNALHNNSHIETKTSYHFFCPLCGNEFTLNYECEPDYCQSCRLSVSFMMEKKVTQVTIVEQYCPMCNQYFNTSAFINSLFENDDKARWLSNMVMHHRHDHITSWNSNWSKNGFARNYLNVDYNKEKHKVNERAKRQIVRKCRDYMIQHGFYAEDVIKLQGTEQNTIDAYKKYLPTNNQNNTILNLKI